MTTRSQADVRGESGLELARGVLRRIQVKTLIETWGLLGILILVLVVFSVLRPTTFFTTGNFTAIPQEQSVLACVTLGLIVPIAAGEFDLSVGYTVGFTAVLAVALVEKTSMSGVASVAITILTGLVIGLINGLLVTRFAIHSLIATLGTGFAIEGLTVGVSGSQTLYAGVPPFIPTATNTTFAGLQTSVWIVLGLAILTYIILTRTPFGRKVYAVGGSARVARLAGIRTNAIKVAAFCIAGLFAALAGLMQLGEAGAGDPSFGSNLLLPAFAAIFLGATAIRPGYFNVWGTLVAILILAAGFSGLSLMGVPVWVEPVFDGGCLLIAVLFARQEARSIGRRE